MAAVAVVKFGIDLGYFPACLGIIAWSMVGCCASRWGGFVGYHNMEIIVLVLWVGWFLCYHGAFRYAPGWGRFVEAGIVLVLL